MSDRDLDHDLLITVNAKLDFIAEQVKCVKGQQQCATHTQRLNDHDNKFSFYDKIFLAAPIVTIIGLVITYVIKTQ